MPTQTARSSRVSALGALILLAAGANAQCGLTYRPEAAPGTDCWAGCCTMWDPDGPGPRGPLLVCGGPFLGAGNLPTEHIAAYDPATDEWMGLGAGLQGAGVMTLLVLPNGDLLAGGQFWGTGGIYCPYLARFDGTAWQPFAGGSDGSVYDLSLSPNGDLLIAGSFQHVGGVAAQGIARWNGTVWAPIGGGVASAMAIEAMPNGHIVVAGSFTSIGGIPAGCIALWDGNSWSSLGGGMASVPSATINSLAVLPNGELVAGGFFQSAGGVAASCVASWNGTSWVALGANFAILRLKLRANGTLVACPLNSGGAVSWNGASWTPLTPTNPSAVYDFTEQNGDLYVVGSFKAIGNVDAWNVARWDGTAWSALAAGQPPDAPIDALLQMPNGDVVARGSFTRIGGVATNGLARWNGSNWAPIPRNALGPTPSTWLAAANGDLIVHDRLPGSNAFGLIRWNGTAWSMMASAYTTISALAELPNGDFVAGVSHNFLSPPHRYLARWDGTAWTPFAGGADGAVTHLWRLRNGDLIAHGVFTTIGGVPAPGLARWNGTTWSAIGTSPTPRLACLVELRNGDLVVGGGFSSIGNQPASGIARWNGTAWSPIGTGIFGTPGSIVELPGGDLIAAGSVIFIQGATVANDIARWNGSTWNLVGAGFRFGIVKALLQRPSGDLVACGTFTHAGGAAAAYFTSLTPDCPASATSYGSGCASSIGTMALTAERLPWVGDTFRSVATNIAPPSLTFAVFGFAATSMPMVQFHPASAPGCTVLVNPLGSAVASPASPAGRAAFDLRIPAQPALVGTVLRQQFVQAELDPSLQILRLSASNGLEITVGSF